MSNHTFAMFLISAYYMVVALFGAFDLDRSRGSLKVVGTILCLATFGLGATGLIYCWWTVRGPLW